MITSSAPSRPLPQPTVSLPDTVTTPAQVLVPDSDDPPAGPDGAGLPLEDEYDCSYPPDGMQQGAGFPSGFGPQGQHGVPESMLVKMETLPPTVDPARQAEPQPPGVDDEALQEQFEWVLNSLGMPLREGKAVGPRCDDSNEPYLARLVEFDGALSELAKQLESRTSPLRLAEMSPSFHVLASCVATHPAGWPHREPGRWRIGRHLAGAGAPGQGGAGHALRDISAPKKCWTDPAYVHQLVADAKRNDSRGLQARHHLICLDLLNWMQPDRSGEPPRGPKAIAMELARHLNRAVSQHFVDVQRLEEGLGKALAAENLGSESSDAWLLTQPQDAQALWHRLVAWSMVIDTLGTPAYLALTPYGKCCAEGLQDICRELQPACQTARDKVAQLSQRVEMVVAELQQHRMPVQMAPPGPQPVMDLSGQDTAHVLRQLDQRLPAFLQARLERADTDMRHVEARFEQWAAKLGDEWGQPGFDEASCKKGFDALLMMYRQACAKLQRARDAQREWTCTVLADRQAMRAHLSHALTDDDCSALEAARDQRLAELDWDRQMTGQRPTWMLDRYADLRPLVELQQTLHKLPPKKKAPDSQPEQPKPVRNERGSQAASVRRTRDESPQESPAIVLESKSEPVHDSQWLVPPIDDADSRGPRHMGSLMRKDAKDTKHGAQPLKRQSDIPTWSGFEFITPRSGSSSSSSSSSIAVTSSGASGRLAEIAKLRAELPEVVLTRVPDVQALFAKWGYEERKGNGDHINFHKPNTRTFTLVATQGHQQLGPWDAQRVRKHLYNYG